MGQNEERIANKRESLEKTIAKILHRYCNFGWANYYIPGEKFPSLIEELVGSRARPGRSARMSSCNSPAHPADGIGAGPSGEAARRVRDHS